MKNLSGAAYLIAQSALLNAISVPAIAIIIRNVGPDGFGQWNVTTSLVAIATFLTGLGLREVFIRRVVHEPERAESLISYQLGLRFVLALAATALCLALAIALQYGPTMVALTAINAASMVLTTLGAVLLDYLQGHDRFRAMAVVQLVSGFVLTVLSVVLTSVWPTPLMLGVAYAAGPLIALVLLLIILRSQAIVPRMRFNVREFRQLIHTSRVLIYPQFLNAVRDRLEPLIIPKAIGMEAFGYFAAGTMPSSRLNIVADGIVSAYYSSLARHSQHSLEAANAVVAQLIKLVSMACIPIACYLFCLADAIAYILFPRHPEECALIIKVTCWAVPIAAFGQACGCVLQSVGRLADSARGVSRATIVGAALTLVCIYRWGILGACFAMLARAGTVSIFLYYEISKVYKSAILSVPLGRVLLSGSLILLVSRIADVNEILISGRVMAFLVVSAAAYMSALIVSGVLSGSGLRSLVSSLGGQNAA
jgi:PST family polysaccharide transporter